VLSWTIRESWVSVRQALRYYVSFYEKVAEYRHAFVVGLFDEVTQDYGAVLERVNAKFGTRFSPFEHSDDNVSSVFAYIERTHRARRPGGRMDEKQIARPFAGKVELKDALKRELEHPEARKLTTCAEAVYNDLAFPGHGQALFP
jgi:uncharacterized protein YozE (UPF0346 family)